MVDIKLISMTDFVLEQTKINQFRDDCEFAYPVRKYANFLKQPLELWMFVPCDENGNVLEEPDANYYMMVTENEVLKYQQAKERCLFEGFECQKQGGEYLVKFGNEPVWVNWNNSKTIENLSRLKPQLTQTAIKKLGL